MSGKIIAGFGEVMLRLSPAGKKRFAAGAAGTVEATFGGGEANVCASLALFGNRVRYLTALPENPVSAAFAAQMRGIGVEVDRIHYAKTGRMGVYYAEHGAAQRGVRASSTTGKDRASPFWNPKRTISIRCSMESDTSTSPASRRV